MKRLLNGLMVILFGLNCGQLLYAAPLITASEAALPAASGTLATRGISRGPAVKLHSPEEDTPIKAPFDLRFSFEARGESKIDPNSVKVVYMKTPMVDLTPRLKNAITSSGIDFQKAEIPAGTHVLKVTVKDTEGRETNSIINLVVNK